MRVRGVGPLVGTVVAAASLLALSTSAQAASTTADVYLVQGLVGTTADVLVDGATVAPGAAAATVVGPLRLASGSHVVALRDGSDTLVSAKFTVKAGTSTDVVAHRAAVVGSEPVVTVFGNDLSAVPPGKTRLVVSHVAVAPPADIRIDSTPLFRNVANGESVTLELPAKAGTLDIVPTATSGPAILAPVALTLKSGTLTRVFVIGDAASGDTRAVVQVLPVAVTGSTRPTSVRTGDGGQAADAFVGQTPWGLWLLTAGASALGWLMLLKRRSRRPLAIGSRHSR